MTAEIEAAFAAHAAIGGPGPAPGRARSRTVSADASVLFIKGAPVQQQIPASGVAVFDLDGPKTGYQWTVRRVTVSDAAALGASMGSAIAGVYAGQPSPGLITPGNAEWIFPTVPNVANWGSDQLVLQYGEHLFVQVTGATPNQLVVCSAAYQLYMPATVIHDIQV